MTEKPKDKKGEVATIISRLVDDRQLNRTQSDLYLRISNRCYGTPEVAKKD